MTEFVLQPCKIRSDRIVPQKDTEAVTFDWAELKRELVPSNNPKGIRNLRGIERDIYVGTTKHPRNQQEVNFIFRNFDRSNSIGWLLSKDPTFSERIVKVYKVESVKWEATVDETQKKKKSN